MYQLRVLEKARKDMQQSADWYNDQQAGLGERYLREVIDTFQRVKTEPLHYEEKFAKKFRFAPVHVFPFLVIYKIKDQAVIINAVFHTKRDPARYI